MSCDATKARQTLQDAVTIAYRDLRDSGHNHEVALSLVCGEMCGALGYFVARSARGSDRELEHNMMAIACRIENAARKKHNQRRKAEGQS